MPDLAEILTRFRRRDRRALAEILSRVENSEDLSAPELQPTAETVGAKREPAQVVGITGSGGAGKSTLVGALVEVVRGFGLTVGVLACDPQSPVTGGALLGDRIRVRFEPTDEGVYFRSMSTRGAPGGVSAATGAALAWLQAFGFDLILIETVGVGQDQIAVRALVDTLALLVTPNSGDEVQWEKAGLIEVADLIVVNKSDLPGADRVRQQLISALSLGPHGQQPPVLNVIAATGQGVPELWQAICERSKR
ncbi:MAG TPA: GTP-binding protein [Pirellulales bacterium]|jgi:LAO/AO transport system kinase